MSEIPWKQIAEDLYRMLDDIDSHDDMARDNEELYRNLVRETHDRRFRYHHYFDPDGDVSQFNQPVKEQ